MPSGSGPMKKRSLATRIRYRLYLHRRMLWLSIINRLSGRRIVSGSPSGPAISMTTYGRRIHSVFYAIESIAAGTTLPARFTLWLDDKKLFENLPSSLRRLQKRGLEIGLTQNYGPHTKYYPYVSSQDSLEAPMVLADDDVLYPKNWLEVLLKAAAERPHEIHCWMAKVLSVDGSSIREFMQWPTCADSEASFRNMAQGIGGVMHPPEMLRAIKKARTEFLNCCPKADDIWLHAIALRAGIKTRQVPGGGTRHHIIPGTEVGGLWHTNHDGGNDRQIQATYSGADVEALLSPR